MHLQTPHKSSPVTGHHLLAGQQHKRNLTSPAGPPWHTAASVDRTSTTSMLLLLLCEDCSCTTRLIGEQIYCVTV